MKSKLLATLLAMAMLVSLAAGCSSDQPETSDSVEASTAVQEVSTAPNEPVPDASGVELLTWPLEETETLTMFFPWSPRMVQLGYDSPNDFLFYPELESRTNVHIDFQATGADVAQEKFNLIVVAGEYPDLFYNCMDLYSGKIVKALEDEVIVDIAEYVDYIPNYMAARALNEDFTKATLTDEGKMGQFYSLRLNVYGLQGPQIREDWLEDLNIDIPVTYDDWHDMLVAFKDEKGAETPTVAMPSIGGYGMGDDYYQVDGVIHLGFLEDTYLDYLTMCKQWYDDGILDPELVAGNYDVPQFFEFIPSGRSGAWFLDTEMTTGMILQSDDPNFAVVAVRPPVLNEGDELHWSFNEDSVGNGIAISTGCVNVELAVQWLDNWYTDEISLLANYGIEGISFEYGDDGKPYYTELVTGDEEGLNMSMFKYAVDWGPFVMDWTRKESAYNEMQLNAVEVWKGDYDYRIPSWLTFTVDESEIMAQKKTDVDTYREEMVAKFIMGIEPLENFPIFVETLKQLGAEDLVQIYQDSYNRYISR